MSRGRFDKSAAYPPLQPCKTGCGRQIRDFDGHGYCKVCLRLQAISPQTLADARDKQVGEALHVMQHQTYIRWPYDALHRMAGPIPTGSVVYIGARSGGGKTTFMYSTIEQWRVMGYGITVLPLEQRPRDWRVGWSAVRCGVRADDVLSGELSERMKGGEEFARQQMERVMRDVALQAVDPALQKVNVCVDATVDVTGLEVACAVAHDRGDQIVVVDHIDHISGEGKRGGTMDSAPLKR